MFRDSISSFIFSVKNHNKSSMFFGIKLFSSNGGYIVPSMGPFPIELHTILVFSKKKKEKEIKNSITKIIFSELHREFTDYSEAYTLKYTWETSKFCR